MVGGGGARTRPRELSPRGTGDRQPSDPPRRTQPGGPPIRGFLMRGTKVPEHRRGYLENFVSSWDHCLSEKGTKETSANKQGRSEQTATTRDRPTTSNRTLAAGSTREATRPQNQEAPANASRVGPPTFCNFSRSWVLGSTPIACLFSQWVWGWRTRRPVGTSGPTTVYISQVGW